MIRLSWKRRVIYVGFNTPSQQIEYVLQLASEFEIPFVDRNCVVVISKWS